MTTAPQARGWFTVEAGAGVRRQLRRQIEKAAISHGLTLEVQEAKGLLETSYRFTAIGEVGRVQRFVSEMSQWIRSL